MKQVVVFAENDFGTRAYRIIEGNANTWLSEHPEVQIIASHTNLYATDDSSEFVLTLIVEIPNILSELMQEEALSSIRRNDPAHITEIAQDLKCSEEDARLVCMHLVKVGKITTAGYDNQLFSPA